MKKGYYSVGWGDTIRLAGPVLDERAACVDCYGMLSKDMVVVRMPGNPRYMSAKAKQEIYAKIREKLDKITERDQS